MEVVITGAKGFVGAELVGQCVQRGIKVIGIDVIKSCEENHHSLDINSEEISSVIPYGCDALIHLAALSRDDDCKNRAYECFKINVMGTLNLLEAAQKKNVKQFIFASSEWVYDNCREEEIKDENSFINIVNHNSEYALSKLVSESNLRQKHLNGFCSVTILRFGIIYGARRRNWSAVESLFNDVMTKEVISVGSLKTGRCFIHVSDIASGIVRSIGLSGFNIVNLEGDRLITLEEIIQTSTIILKKEPRVIEKAPDSVSVRNVSNNKAKEVLNWAPKFDLEEGLRSLIRTGI
jgi:UDP-glucose 4-epimerase